MRICEDCIHYHVCDHVPEYANKGEVCLGFKDKSRFLELPCAIGDTVFMITEKTDPYDGIIYHTIIQVPFRISLLHLIGKVIFLTQEEAEKKLEGLK